MGLLGAIGGFIGGGVVGGMVGGLFGSGGGGGSSVSYPPQPDYSDVMIYMSDNNRTVAMMQIGAQMMAMEQASLDREMQLAVNLELGMERLDTRLQVAKLDFFQGMAGEENRHVERMAELNKGRSSGLTLPDSDLPEPPSLG